MDRKSRKPWIYIALLTLLFAEVGAAAWSGMQCTRTGYEITQATTRREELESRRRSLKVELAHLESPERIIRIGEQELGLVLPVLDQVVVVQ